MREEVEEGVAGKTERKVEGEGRGRRRGEAGRWGNKIVAN